MTNESQVSNENSSPTWLDEILEDEDSPCMFDEPFLGEQGSDESGNPTTIIGGHEYVLKKWPASQCYHVRDQLIETLGLNALNSLTKIPRAIGEVSLAYQSDSSYDSDEVAEAWGVMLTTAIQGAVQGVVQAGGIRSLMRLALEGKVYRMSEVDGKPARRRVFSVKDYKDEDGDFNTFYAGRIYDIDRLVCWVLWTNLKDFIQGLLLGKKKKARSEKRT